MIPSRVLLVPANVLPPDEREHCQAPARAPDLDRRLPEGVRELGQARLAIEQPEQHSHLRGRTLGPLELLEHAIESGPPGPGDRSVSGAIARDALQLEVSATDRKLNHAPIVDASRGTNNGCQPASRPPTMRSAPDWRAATRARVHERSAPSTPTTSEVVWRITTLPTPLSAGTRLYWPDGASRRRPHPTQRFQDGSVSGTEYTLGPMAGGYLRGEHES